MPISATQIPGVLPGVRRSFIVVFSFAILFGVSGCKYWYKPGGTAAELQRDEDSCRVRSGAENSTPEFVDCMHARSQPDNPAPAARASAQSDQAKTVPVQTDTSTRPARSKPSRPENVPEVVPIPAEQSAEPHIENQNVSSWWKFGGSPEQLAQDQDICLGKFDKNPSGDGIAWEASAELQNCMKGRGWRAVH